MELLTSPSDASWMRFAACRAVDPDLFFPTTGGIGLKEAKRVCTQCPCRVACLDFAIENNEKYGVWGGTSERERRVLRRIHLTKPTTLVV